MKKILALVLTLVLLVSFASMAFAVTVSVDGNLRMWYGYVTNDAANSGKGLSETSFRFDRLALDVNAVFDQNSGIISEVQFRNLQTSKDGATTSTADSSGGGTTYPVTTKSNTGNSVDIRVDLGYYYLKNALFAGDTFMVGAFDGQVPYKNGYGYPLISSGLGDATKIGQSVGMVYQITKPLWSFGVGVVNASQGTAQNDSVANSASNSKEEGYDWSSRLNFTPAAGLKIGVGYASVLDAASTTKSDGTVVDAMWSRRMIADISYSNPAVFPISGMIEWSQITDKDKIVSDDSTSALYGELGYTVGKAIIYAGRAINLSDNNYFMANYDTNGGFVGYDAVKQKNSYSVVGVKYTVTPNTFLQGEVVMIDDNASFKNAEWAGLRSPY